jgi:hypothetical protein
MRSYVNQALINAGILRRIAGSETTGRDQRRCVSCRAYKRKIGSIGHDRLVTLDIIKHDQDVRFQRQQWHIKAVGDHQPNIAVEKIIDAIMRQAVLNRIECSLMAVIVPYPFGSRRIKSLPDIWSPQNAGRKVSELGIRIKCGPILMSEHYVCSLASAAAADMEGVRKGFCSSKSTAAIFLD